MKIAVVGDFHCPERCPKLLLLEELKKEKPELIIGTGDYTTQEVIEKLSEIAEFKGVLGNVDSAEIDLPRHLLLEIEGMKIVVFHSKEIYPRGDIHAMYAKWKDENPDLVIFGHTHKPFFSFLGGVYFLNPGSFNGVISGEGERTLPSFAILDIKKEKLNVKFISKRAHR
jgi:putative phosphoesterase